MRQLIEKLGLTQHIQGGYFKQTYKSPIYHNGRSQMTVIYYMLTKLSAVDTWHMNKSDIMHFHHQGGSIRYMFIDATDGHLQEYTLGKDLDKGEVMQLMVPGNTWKACFLLDGGYGLISEAVAPGFEYEDMRIGKEEELELQFPQQKDIIRSLEKLKTKNQEK